MPHTCNTARRHKFDKAQYRVINLAEYNESLRQRRYSDLAIETCLTLRTAYRLGLRQTQGLMGSIGTLMGLDIRVPDYSTLSRRANGLSIAQAMRQAGSVPVHRVVHSTASRSSAKENGSRRSIKSREYAAAGANSTSDWTSIAVRLFAPI